MKTPLLAFAASIAMIAGSPALAGQAEGTDPDKAQSSPDTQDPGSQQIPLSVLLDFTLQDEDFAAFRTALLQQMLERGQPLENWSTRGVDMPRTLAEFATQRGSAFRLEEDDTSTAIIYEGEPQPLLPSTYIRERIYEGTATGDTETLLMSVAPDIWLELVGGYNKVGTAQCMSGISTVTVLSDKVGSEWNEGALGAVAILRSMLIEIDSLQFCTVTERNEDGSFTAKVVDPDGLQLSELNEELSRETIVSRDDAIAAIARANARPDPFEEETLPPSESPAEGE